MVLCPLLSIFSVTVTRLPTFTSGFTLTVVLVDIRLYLWLVPLALILIDLPAWNDSTVPLSVSCWCEAVCMGMVLGFCVSVPGCAWLYGDCGWLVAGRCAYTIALPANSKPHDSKLKMCLM